ncbi:hypothetical protein QW180_28745 [Vibrio sinaloensis]|nr:hypothetical protein [Vibrio sinaloensis]
MGLNYDAPSSNWGTSVKFNYTSNKSRGDLNLDEKKMAVTKIKLSCQARQ